MKFSNKIVCFTLFYSRHYCNIRVTQVVLTPCAFIPAKSWYWQPQEMEPLIYGNVRFTLPMRVPRVEWPHPRTNLIPWRGRAAKLLVRYYYLFELFFWFKVKYFGKDVGYITKLEPLFSGISLYLDIKQCSLISENKSAIWKSWLQLFSSRVCKLFVYFIQWHDTYLPSNT